MKIPTIPKVLNSLIFEIPAFFKITICEVERSWLTVKTIEIPTAKGIIEYSIYGIIWKETAATSCIVTIDSSARSFAILSVCTAIKTAERNGVILKKNERYNLIMYFW